MDLSLVPIGVVRNGKDARPPDGWREIESRVELDPRYGPALLGIEDYSHLTVVFWLHRMTDEDRTRLQVNPRGRMDLPRTGVFATRSQYRPNPIAVTRVRLIRREDETLIVRGLDAVDGTPVIDIKGDLHPDDERAEYPAWTYALRQDNGGRKR